MPRIKKLLLSFVASLLLLGCSATPTQKPVDVGAVVVVQPPRLPPPPALVRATEPKPPGYFQKSLLDFFNSKPTKPTP